MKKTFKVVMLPTEKAKNSILLNNSNKLTYFKNYLTQDYLKNVLNSNSNHLYITSDDEIKEGDWYIDNRVVNTLIVSNTPMHKDKIFACKKIVATTDSSLLVYLTDLAPKANYPLPQIPESFIQAYIKAYNESKPITEVDLEIEDNFKSDNNAYYIIKTRPDNTVIVYQSKQFTYQNALDFATWYSGMDKEKVKKQLDKWIQNNLK